MLEGAELSDGFLGVAHHVADGVLLDGVIPLAHFQLCLVLQVKTEHDGHAISVIKGPHCFIYSAASLFIGSYFGLGFTFLAVTGEVVGLSQPQIAVICWVEEVYVADEHLEGQ